MKNNILLFFLFISTLLIAQNQTNNWYFGDKAGIDFNSGRRTIKTDGEVIAPEGCATFSDHNGDLLFYTNGHTVWNKNHEIMENGEGLPGQLNHTQSTIIIPKPGSEEIYYIFTTRTNNTTTPPLIGEGVYLTEVEISDEHPLGVIKVKFQQIATTSSERISAVHSKDGTFFWVITHGKAGFGADELYNTFFVYKVDSNGVSNPERIPQPQFLQARGSLKISPNGKYIAVAGYFNQRIYVYNFDNETGQIDFREEVLADTFLFSPKNPYGLEFSLDSKKLYYTGPVGSSLSTINQYFIERPVPETIDFVGKEQLIGSNSIKFGAMQLAKDGNIYVANFTENDGELLGAPTITVLENINNERPDIDVASIGLRGNNSFRGLPNFIQSYFLNRITTENKCFVDTFIFEISAFTTIQSITWDFGDGNTSTVMNPSHQYNSPGEYLVIASITLNGQVFKVNKLVEAYPLPSLNTGAVIEQCDDDMDGLSSFNLTDAILDFANVTNIREISFEYYTSRQDAENRTNVISNPESFENTVPNQEIFVRATTNFGCTDFTTFRVRARFVQLETVSDSFYCENIDEGATPGTGIVNKDALEEKVRTELSIAQTVNLKFFRTYSDALNNLNELLFDFSSPTSTIYIKAEEAGESCSGITEAKVIINPKPTIDLEENYEICFDPSLKPPVVLSGDLSNERFEWRNEANEIISTSVNFTLTAIGSYSLTTFKTENGLLCSNYQEFTVTNPEKPSFGEITVNTEDETNNILTVSVLGNSSYQFSLDNQNFDGNGNRYIFTNVDAGLIDVFVKDINDCEEPIQTTVSVIGFRKFFTPNGDGNNDYWNIRGIDANSFKSIEVIIFDRFGTVLGTITELGSKGWDGTYNGKKQSENNYWFKAKIVDKEDNVISRSGNFSLVIN